MRYSRCAAAALAVTALFACAAEPDEPRGDVADEDAAAAPAPPATPAEPRADAITCTYPVQRDDTGESLLARFGPEARSETLYGPEGIEIPSVVLWPDDPARRIAVQFGDEARRELASVNLTDAARWRIAGLAVGDQLARVAEANGGAFALWGFSWDYGGYVSDLRGGRLATLPGGCRAILRLGPADEVAVPEALMGDMELSSDNPLLEGVGVKIDELGIIFPSRE